MNDGFASQHESVKVEPVHLVRNGEITIDASTETTWPHVINYPSWQNYSIVEHVSGEAGAEGEVVLLKKEEAGLVFPPYYARTIKLEPGRRVMWKTYPQARTPERDYFGFVEFRLYDAGGKTRFCYSSIYEYQVPYREEIELENFRRQQDKNSEAMYSTILAKLKNLVEKSA